ncbi:transposase [Streptomyces sp. NPDC093064]|uniref:transposase n=1 Tax=Streptomyces sp. NPDC093064 TaxID=3366020 RepID=UPI00382592A8
MTEPLLPPGDRSPIPDLRRLVNSVMWRFCTGSPWRDMPKQRWALASGETVIAEKALR